MAKGCVETGPTMVTRMSSSRGPQRFLMLAVLVLFTMFGVNHWRLVNSNAELNQRIGQLQRLLEQDESRRARLENELQDCKDATLKAADEQHRLEQEREQRQLDLQHQEARVANLEDGCDDCRRLAETRARKLEAAEAGLEVARHNLTHCLTQGCGDRVKELQFDLDTCRFSQKHAGNPGIIRPNGEDKSRGPGQLPLLSPAVVFARQPALNGFRHRGGQIMISDPPDSYRPPPQLSVAALPAAADAKPALLDSLPESKPDKPPADDAPAKTKKKSKKDRGAAATEEKDKSSVALVEEEQMEAEGLADLEEPDAA